MMELEKAASKTTRSDKVNFVFIYLLFPTGLFQYDLGLEGVQAKSRQCSSFHNFFRNLASLQNPRVNSIVGSACLGMRIVTTSNRWDMSHTLKILRYTLAVRVICRCLRRFTLVITGVNSSDLRVLPSIKQSVDPSSAIRSISPVTCTPLLF